MTAELQRAAVEAAQQAGRVLQRAYGQAREIQHKGSIDLVTSADRAAEEAILELVTREFPDHLVLAEESGARSGEAPYRWVVDPLDGTVNFAHGLPHFCVTLAVQERRGAEWSTLVGVTYDPLREELFVARAGAGSTLNGAPIRVSRAAKLIDAVGATGFSYERLTHGPDNHREFCLLNLVTRGVRRFGSAGLDLAYLACGRYDLYWEYALKPWDVAAGALLVTEAGGALSGAGGAPWALGAELLVASNGPLHAPLLTALETAHRFAINSREAAALLLPPELAAAARAREGAVR